MLRRVPLALLGLSLGGVLLVMGIIAYAMGNATLNLAGFFYGFALLLGGLALKASELKPVPLSAPTSPEVLALRDAQATVTQTKLRKDVTRYCYGQDVHLDEALQRLDLSPSNEERPVLQALREVSTAGAYTLILEFASPEIPLSRWESRVPKMETYFGPDIQVQVTQPKPEQIEVALIRQTAPVAAVVGEGESH
ncbi:DUF2854 domain-containing protein [Synechococcales cyanobacterium C]|uniref:DUF2854 domain-containing protein n=1 Tax=Petrachloros mirabilis ULC683 TaxID=2781853 RepID=A0A8K1ZZM0_9CYAN|nr:DUF2854 domain-containing protein [Petrachloros mirabilis]NCJ08084.1 DUF2854 domain-containing protein [Petrachloros mirabilis ULC683]